MKIGLIHYSYPPVVGGVEFVMQGQARQFALHGHRVRVIAANKAGAEKNIRCFALSGMRALRKSAKELPAARRRLTQALRPLVRGLDLILVHNIMSMHFNFALTAALWDLALETRGRTRWIFWTHDLSLGNPDYPRLDTRRLPFSLLKQRHPSAHYVAVSDLRRRELCGLLRIPRAQVRVVPDGVDVPALLDLDPGVWRFFLRQKLADQDCVLFFPARVLPRKNLEAAVRLVAQFKKLRKKVTLLITGAPDPHNPSAAAYFRRVQALVKRSGLRKDVVFLDQTFRVGFRKLVSLYRLCDAVIMTSRQEGFGLPLLEGGIQSKPVICPRRLPFTEIVEGRAIFLDEKKPAAAARAILSALKRSPTAAQFKRILRGYSWQAVWENHLSRLVP